jgi:hypothetical protein
MTIREGHIYNIREAINFYNRMFLNDVYLYQYSLFYLGLIG